MSTLGLYLFFYTIQNPKIPVETALTEVGASGLEGSRAPAALCLVPLQYCGDITIRGEKIQNGSDCCRITNKSNKEG